MFPSRIGTIYTCMCTTNKKPSLLLLLLYYLLHCTSLQLHSYTGVFLKHFITMNIWNHTNCHDHSRSCYVILFMTNCLSQSMASSMLITIGIMFGSLLGNSYENVRKSCHYTASVWAVAYNSSEKTI